MAEHPWLSKSTDELLAMTLAQQPMPYSAETVTLPLLIQKKIADAQLVAAAQTAKSGDLLAARTSDLVGATKSLVRATWAVAIATIVLGLFAVITAFLEILRMIAPTTGGL